MTRAQNALYWREWSAAKRALMPGRETWTKHEENTRRHAITIEALGHDKSHLDFSNSDFDKVLGALRAISKPGDLNAQLRQVRGAHRRARYALDQLMRELQVDRNYVQGVVDQMNFGGTPAFSFSDALRPDAWQRERERAKVPKRLLEELTEPELKKVIIALRKQVRRNLAVSADKSRGLPARSPSPQPEPAEVPF